MPASIGHYCFLWHTMRYWNRFRTAPCGVACTLVLTCAWAPGSARQQDAAASTTSTAPSKAGTHASTPKSLSTTAKASKTRAASTRRSRKKSVRGQQKIDSERAREIQEALIREHYLAGDPSGTWNQASEDAMRRYQEDHGWQTKEVPDSRALIKLGLGPSKDHLLNPESAMTTAPDAPRSDAPAPASHTPQPVSNAPAQTPAQGDPPGPQ
jgi:hypothetical protein